MSTIQTTCFLDTILARKQARLQEQFSQTDRLRLAAEITALETGRPAGQPGPGDRFMQALRQKGPLAMILEIKKASPSRGLIQAAFDPGRRAAIYRDAGAAALSVLTEEDYFLGSSTDLAEAVQSAAIPVLCKDFIIDPVQIWQARKLGASAVLLIVAALGQARLDEFLQHCRQSGLAALVEVHDLSELLIALSAGARLIGINNRDLRSFHVDLATTERLAGLIPSDRLVVSESGIGGSRDMARVYRAGAKAVLIGESLMRLSDPDHIRARIQDLLQEVPG